MRMARSKWFVPLFSVALGIMVFAAQWIGGDPASGLESLAIMTAFGASIVFGAQRDDPRPVAATGATSASG